VINRERERDREAEKIHLRRAAVLGAADENGATLAGF